MAGRSLAGGDGGSEEATCEAGSRKCVCVGGDEDIVESLSLSCRGLELKFQVHMSETKVNRQSSRFPPITELICKSIIVCLFRSPLYLM